MYLYLLVIIYVQIQCTREKVWNLMLDVYHKSPVVSLREESFNSDDQVTFTNINKTNNHMISVST